MTIDPVELWQNGLGRALARMSVPAREAVAIDSLEISTTSGSASPTSP